MKIAESSMYYRSRLNQEELAFLNQLSVSKVDDLKVQLQNMMGQVGEGVEGELEKVFLAGLLSKLNDVQPYDFKEASEIF